MNMDKKKPKNYFFNFLTVIISIILSILVINVIFVKISNQKFFPRALSYSLSNILLTFYTDTYDKKNLNKYVALLGDSYSQGAGDAYLSGIADYAIAHHLYKKDKKNYLNFGRGGYGSISAVSNLILVKNLSNLPNLIYDLNMPDSIIFIFYEGNDLEENIYEYNFLKKKDEEISDFVKRRIEENIKFNKIDKLNNTFPILLFIKNIYAHLSWHFSLLLDQIKKAESFNELKSLLIDRVKKLIGKTIILNPEQPDFNTHINSINGNNKIKNILPLQSSAIILSKDEIKISLEVFFESIKYLKNWSQTKNISILYIPSPINSYSWNEPIIFEFKSPKSGETIAKYNKTTNDENHLNSKLIREKIDYFSKNQNIEFLDATNFLNEIGKKTILHGPLDWRHFNYDGYKNISNFIIKNVSTN